MRAPEVQPDRPACVATRPIWVGLQIALLLCASTTAQTAPEIPEADLRTWLTELSSEACAGRGTGSEGFRRAATFVRDHFAEVGLEPAGDGDSFFQRIPWIRSAADPETSHLEVRVGDRLLYRAHPGDGLHGYAARGVDARGGVVVVVARKGLDPDTVRGRQLRGKIALVVADAEPYRQIEIALRSAAAVIQVDDLACHLAPALDGHNRPGKGAGNRAVQARGLRPNALFTTTEVLDAVLAGAGRSREDLESGVVSLPGLDGALRLDIRDADAPAYNVVGILRGNDPALREQYVAIGCHLDHLGIVNGRVHPGADDDGSGTVGVMALARALADAQPRRSVLFVAFCGEELGLLGSKWFVENPPVPLRSIVAELQMDMIGRSEAKGGERAEDNRDSLHLIGTRKLSMDLHDLCIARNESGAGFDLEWDEEDVFLRSDHYHFARMGIPVAFFFTGFHGDYHRPTDTVDKIEFGKLRRVVGYVYDIALELAMADGRPQLDPARWRRLKRQLRGKAAKVPAAPMKKPK